MQLVLDLHVAEIHIGAQLLQPVTIVKTKQVDQSITHLFHLTYGIHRKQILGP